MSTNRDTFHSLAMLQLRKAALLAHWLPGLGVTVRQHDARIVRVGLQPPHPSHASYALELHPCAFRRFVLALAAPVSSQRPPIDPMADVDLELVTSAATRLGPHGLVRAQIDETISVLGFACAIELALAESLSAEYRESVDRRGVRPMPIHIDHDAELGVTMIHRTFDTASPLQEHRVLELLLDLAPAFGAEEIVGQFARGT